MKKISILVLEGAILGAIEGPHKVFTEVNEYMKSVGKEPVFDVQLIGLQKETKLNNGLFTVSAHVLLDEAARPDLIIIPAMHGDLQHAMEINKAFIPWIVEQYNKGSEVASLCIGAFLLAATGLLKGKKCATHWLVADYFTKMFPDVNLVAEKIITDEKGIYSSGGAYSYLNLILYLIEKFAGRDASIFCAKVFAIEIERDNQLSFIMFKGQKEHDDSSIVQAQAFIENNFKDRITIDSLASLVSISRRNLERRFKKATSNTVAEYIQRVRIEAAKISLEASRENVNEVMYNVGYIDPKAFRIAFKRLTGLTPIEYRNKYKRNLSAVA